MKLLIFTDSLALARSSPEIVTSDKTWPELLRITKGYRIFQCSIGGATSTQLRSQSNYFNPECYDVDCVIIQCGIVDCAPRFLHRTELNFLKKIPFVGNIIINLLNKQFVRKLRNITYTSKEDFLKNIIYFNKKYTPSKVVFLEIVPAGNEYEKKLPGISKNIQIYNDILSKNANAISLNGIENGGVMSDFHHLNEIGHKLVYERVEEYLAAKTKNTEQNKKA